MIITGVAGDRKWMTSLRMPKLPRHLHLRVAGRSRRKSPDMRILLAVLICSFPIRADGLDLEIAPGWTWSTDVSASAPVVRARAGYDTRWLTYSLVGLAALFTDPGPLMHQGQGGGLRAWGLAAEGRVHGQGKGRFFAALGAGFGQLTVLQAANADTEGYRGAAAPYVEGVLGYQYVGRPLRVGIELTLDVFNRVHLDGDLGNRICVDGGGSPDGFVRFCPTGRPFPLVGLVLTLGANVD